MATKITTESFGQTKDGKNVTRYTLSNSKGVVIKIIDFGAIITDIHVPDKDGKIGDVTFGFDNIQDYESQSLYFGAIVGRTVGRIAGGEFTLDGKTHQLCVNNGPNAAHGGKVGFDKKMWSAEIKEDKLSLSYTSPDGEENYPGDLTTTVTYSLDQDNCLKLEYSATTTKTTILNVTNHAYFNLAGHECGHINDHVMTMHAESYLPVNEHSIPTGEVRKVAGSLYDLRSPVRIGDRLENIPGGVGYDNNYCLDNNGQMKLAARVEHPPSGRYMECSTTEPGVNLYTAFYVSQMTGKGGATYGKFGALCLEAQHYPDSIHQPAFPSTVLQPGETYTQTTVYKFGVL